MPMSAAKAVCASVLLLVLTIGVAAAEQRVDLLGDPLPDGVAARTGSGRMRHPSSSRTLAFSPDGKSIVSGGGSSVRIWDADTGKLRRRIDVAADFLTFASTTDGIAVASARLDTKIVTVQVFDPATGRVKRRVEMPERTTDYVLTISPDGKGLAYSAGKARRVVYDVGTGREVLCFPSATHLAFAPDAKTLVVCDYSDTIRIHDVATGKMVRECKQPGDKVAFAYFSPDGRSLASFSWNDNAEPGTARIWDIGSGAELHRLKSPGGVVLCVAFSPDGKYVATGCQHHDLILWDVKTGKEVRRYPTDAFFGTVAFSPEGKRLAAVSGEGAIRLWDVATGRVLPASVDPFVNTIRDLHFSSDGRRLLGHAGVHLAWDPATGRELRRTPRVSDRYWPGSLSPDESLFATADKDGAIHLWDAATGRAVQTLKGHEKWVYQLLFTPDGRRLISTSPDDTTRIWDVASGRQTHKLVSPGLSRLAVSPDGRWLAVNGRSTAVWDLATGQEKVRMTTAGGELAFSPDGRQLAEVGGGVRRNEPGTVTLWGVSTGMAQRALIGHKSRVYGVDFSRDGRMLATGDAEGHLFLWELASGRKRHEFVGHESAIRSLAFSPDGRLLAASSPEAPVYVWDVTGAALQPRRRHSDVQLRRCWADMMNMDAIGAFQAMRRLVAAPEQTLPYFRENLKPVPAPDLPRICRLVQALDSDDFVTRQKAAEELEKQADAASAELRKAAKESSSLYVRRTLQQMLEGLETSPEALRAVRAVEVLEWIATPDAARLLDELAKGAPDARLTREAIAARERLRKSPR